MEGHLGEIEHKIREATCYEMSLQYKEKNEFIELENVQRVEDTSYEGVKYHFDDKEVINEIFGNN